MAVAGELVLRHVPAPHAAGFGVGEDEAHLDGQDLSQAREELLRSPVAAAGEQAAPLDVEKQLFLSGLGAEACEQPDDRSLLLQRLADALDVGDLPDADLFACPS